MKLCYRCGVEKPLLEFYRKNARCKTCCIELARANALADHEAYKERMRVYRLDNIERLRIHKAAWHQKTKLARRAMLRENNVAWRKANPEKYRAQLARRRLDPAKNAENARRHDAAKRRQAPKWADRRAVLAFYREAQRLTRETGVKHSVDHIVPLHHPLVAGLHVEANLRVITHSENSGKRNKFSVGAEN